MMKSIDHESSKAAKGMAAMYDRDIHLKRESYSTELEYFEKIRAHRVYQYAMSRYKLMRYLSCVCILTLECEGSKNELATS